MLNHVVMIRLKAEANDQAEELQRRLATLPPKIDAIKSYEIGVDELQSDRSWDVVIVSQFESFDTLKTYSAHPAHVAVLEFIQEIAAKVAVVDYHS